jgi:hypothetical protein
MSAKTLPLLGSLFLMVARTLAACIGDDTVVPTGDAGADATVDAPPADSGAGNDASDRSAAGDANASDASRDAVGN